MILSVALAVRLGWAVAQPRTAAGIDRLPDQREYLTLADDLLRHGQLRLFDPRFGQNVFAYRLPGYPAAIAACGGSVLVVRLAQAALDTATVLGVFLIGRRLAGGPAAVVAAGLVAVNPVYVYFSGLVLTETPFAAAVVWATVALVAGPGWGLQPRAVAAGAATPGRRWVPLAAVCVAAAALLRPTALVLGPALAVVSGFGRSNRTGRPTYQPQALVGVLLGIGLALAPWAWRNGRVLGTAVWTTTNDGITFFDGFHDGAAGGSDQRFVGGLVERFPALRSMNEVDRSRDLARRARAWAVGHPGAALVLSARKVLRGWSPVPLSADFGRPLYRLAGGGYAVPFDVLCLIGLCSGRLTRRAKALLLTPAVVLTAVQVMTVGSIRYRMPAEAPLAVLAGVGAVAVWCRVRVGGRQSHAPARLHTAPPV